MVRYVVHKLGPNYFGVWDKRTEMYVATRRSRDAAQREADALNRQPLTS